MSDTEDIFVDESFNESAHDSPGSNEYFSVEETGSEEDEEDQEERQVRERMKKRQSLRMSLHPTHESSSESESESSSESENEQGGEEGLEISNASDENTSDEDEVRPFSPITRMSITGVKPDDLEDSSDEGDSFIVLRKVKRNVLSSDTESEDEEPKKRASLPKKAREGSLSATPVREKDNHDSFNDSLSLHDYNPEGDKQDSISAKLSSTVINEESKPDNFGELGDSRQRLSIQLRESLGTKFSSTMVDSPKLTECVAVRSPSPAIELISSSDDEKENKPLVQPTIKSALVKQQVSQSHYDSKMRKLSDLRTRLEKLTALTKTAQCLPDKGEGLYRAISEVKKEIAARSSEVGLMDVHEAKDIRNEIQKSFESSINSDRILVDSNVSTNASVQLTDANPAPKNNQVINISWDDIKKSTDDIQPKYTGKKGIATFENQKTLTLNRLANLHKSIETCPTEDTVAEPPKLLKIELMPHQLHGLAWMLWRESQKPRGGILADDMGLGKTLSMISLILKSAELDDPDKEKESSSDSDQSVEVVDSGWTAKGRKDYYAGGTLIASPASLIKQWENEIKTRVARNSLAVCVYHGSNRDVKPRHLAKYDVVITTLNLIGREYKLVRGGIFAVDWERIILDEAHIIRNHKSVMSEACCKLKGKYRWVLTGTPIQNREMDMYALLKFLRCTPFDDLTHWKRWIDKSSGGAARLNTIMKTLMLRRTKQQLRQNGTLESLPEKHCDLIEVKLDKDEMNVYQRVLLYSRTLFSAFLHQRVEKEHDIYRGTFVSNPTYKQTRQPNAAFDRMHQKLKELHTGNEVKQHQILVLLLRLRQICCHPGLIQQMLQDDEGNFDISTIEEDDQLQLDLLEQLDKLKIGDPLSNVSGQGELNISDQLPENTEAISRASSKVMLRSNPVFDLRRLSSKIAKLLQLLESKILNGTDKAIIVSQWSSVLDIVSTHLQAKRVRYVTLSGKVPVKFRNDIVMQFNKPDSGPQVMLLSLTAGGVGLNLVGANHLLVLDPHWNPQLEAQAQDRIYRVGQKKPVHIYKFYCVDTVEQAIRKIQDKKIGIADEVLTGTKHTGSKLTIDDLKTLFGL